MFFGGNGGLRRGYVGLDVVGGDHDGPSTKLKEKGGNQVDIGTPLPRTSPLGLP